MLEQNQDDSLYRNHMQQLIVVASYAAPQGVDVVPVMIEPQVECVEILTGGKVFFEVDGHMREWGRGTIFWHIGGEYTVCKTPPDDPYRCLVLRFLVDKQAPGWRPAPRVSVWNDSASLSVFVKEAMAAFHHEHCNAQQLGFYCYHTLLWQSRRYDRRPAAENLPGVLRRAMQYLEQHYSEPIGMPELAGALHLSQPYLFELFRKHLKTSPCQYLGELRLTRARTLLAANVLEIKEVASLCGYENLEVFYRAFKRNTGVTPGTYREQHRPY